MGEIAPWLALAVAALSLWRSFRQDAAVEVAKLREDVVLLGKALDAHRLAAAQTYSERGEMRREVDRLESALVEPMRTLGEKVQDLAVSVAAAQGSSRGRP